MNDFISACEVMREQLGHDVTISLATSINDKVSVRIVDGYYQDGCIYIVTYLASQKMQEVTVNSNVAICKDLFSAQGIGTNMGHPKNEDNLELSKKLREVFISFYDRHVNEDDPQTCILKIVLTNAVAFTKDTKYIVDFTSRTATKYPFVNDIII